MSRSATLILASLILIIIFTVISLFYRDQNGNKTGELLKCENCNLIIVSLTNTRKDHVGIYGYDRDTTPNIDEYFKNSLIFNNAFAPASWTLPNAATFFTSLFPPSHGVMTRFTDINQALSPKALTFAEILQNNGYQTAAFTGGGDYNSIFGLDQGFKVYTDARDYNYEELNDNPQNLGRNRTKTFQYAPVRVTINPALKWLKNNADEKFFLFLQGYDPHCPFVPAPPFDKKFTAGLKSDLDYTYCLWTFDRTEPVIREGKKYWPVKTGIKPDLSVDDVWLSEDDLRYMIALYDGKIAESDFYLKKLWETIKEFDLEKNTIIIFTSEHGDLFGEHGRFMRGGPLRGTFYDQVLNFPLLIKHPKIQESIEVNDLVQTADLMPTLLDIFGLPDPESDLRQGRILKLSALGDKETNEYVYAASEFTPREDIYFNGTSSVRSIRDHNWKLIKETISDSQTLEDSTGKRNSVSYELYNIGEDPKETKDLYDPENRIARKLSDELEAWFNALTKGNYDNRK